MTIGSRGLGAGNGKLGPGIWTWSLPAGPRQCPGQSALCARLCYAKRGFFRMPTVSRAHLRNWEISQTEEFVPWMIATIHREQVSVLRIHVSGDFYSPAYTEKWQAIAKARPGTTFFAYTRSWRDDAIFPELVRLGQQPNVSLWWSVDRETGPAPLVRGIRTAYMAVNDVDATTAPDDVDLVFRNQPRTCMKKTSAGVQVCPAEACIPGTHRFTCTNCRICWRAGVPRWLQLLGPGMTRAREILYPEAPETASPRSRRKPARPRRRRQSQPA